MKYRYISDSHVHSDSSRDAVDSAMMMCEIAAHLGLYALTVTDHCECNAYVSESYNKSIRQSFFEVRKSAAVFNSRLHVYTGVEIGQPMQDVDAAEDALSACDFDFVLASVHNIKNHEDFFDLDYAHTDINDVINRYFDEILEMIEWGKFDSLSHLTYPWRYIVGEYNIAIDDDIYKDRVDEVLKALIKNNKALEVNTSGLRQKLGKTMPDLPILSRYKSFGGKLITIGSDAHRWADVGSGIEKGLSILRKIGFSHFVIYVHNQPVFLPIE